MAKLTLSSIATTYASVATINANNALIVAEFDNTLSLDGSTPNAMSADLDLGLNQILNVANPTLAKDAVNLETLIAAAAGVFPVPANSVTYTPSGDLVAVEVQAALDELEAEKVPLVGTSTIVGDTAITGDFAVTGELNFTGTSHVLLPAGTVAQRPTGVDGMVRLNVDTNLFEGYKSSAWWTLPTLGSVISPAQLTASVNNWAPTGFADASQVRFDTDAAGYEITGLAISQIEGSEILICNDGAFSITIPHESVSSTAANRFDLSNGLDVLMAGGSTILFTYDATASRWRIKGGAGGGGGATGGGADVIFFLNGQNVTEDYTVAATDNAHSAGPVTIDSGKTVTISSGARWVVI